MTTARIIESDVIDGLRQLEDQSVHTCVTSPPYWGLRDYGTATWEGGDPDCEHKPRHSRPKSGLTGSSIHVDEGTIQRDCHCGAIRVDNQIGLERTPEEYVAKMVEVFRAVRRVLRDDGTVWLNLGSSYFNGGSSNQSADSHGTYGTASRDYRGDDCLSIHLCDACLNSLSCRIEHNETHPFLESVSCIRAPILVRTESLVLCLDSSDSSRLIQIRQSCDAIQDRGQASDHDDGPIPSFLLSKPRASSVLSLQSSSGLCSMCSCRVETQTSTPDVPVYVCTERNNSDTSLTERLLVRRISGRSLFFSAYLNIATPYFKAKDLVSIPQMVAFALQADGWWLRSDIIWHKPNPMPESVTDRPTSAHEYFLLLSKSARYYYDAAAIRERPSREYWQESVGPEYMTAQDGRNDGGKPNGRIRRTDKKRGHGRRHAGFNDRWDHMTREDQQALGANKRDVWTVATKPFPGAHFAVFPPKLIEPCILAGSPIGGTVLDPFSGSGTTGIVAAMHGRNYVGIELNPAYAEMSRRRIEGTTRNLFQVET